MMSKQKELLFLLLSLIIIAGSWFGGTRVIRSKTEEMRNHREEIRAEYEARIEAAEKKEEYLARAEEYNAAYQEMLSRIPFGVSQGEQILFVTELEREFNTYVASVSYSDTIPVYRLEMTESEEGESLSLAYSALQVPIRLEYNEWKRFVDFVLTSSDRTTIPQMTARFDMENGQVDANITLNQYALIRETVSDEAE